MVSTLTLDPPEGESTRLARPLSSKIHNSIKGVIIIEGIYDPSLLLADFPDYNGFIYGAFPANGQEELSRFSVNRYPKRQGATNPWLILHSSGDTLVNIAQAQVMYDHLVKEYSQNDAEPSKSLIHHDFTTLTQEHDDVLESQECAQLISQAVKGWV